MQQDALKDLALETLQSPRSAAQKIMNLFLGRDVLWTALVLVAVLNSIIFGISILTEDVSQLPSFMRNPISFFFIIAGVQVMSVHGFYWAGRAIGGQGDLGDLLSLLVWLQALQMAAQAVLFVVTIIAPTIGQLLSLGVSGMALWITVNFITEALRLPTLLHGVGVIVLAAVGVAFGLMMLIGLIGMGAMGVSPNV
ncbi:YIP1 family protein [Sulfitobacter sp.]|uniref:YIP1 family protein n=1 Tax=Sulfitobacter sp. TaxID=1903071 RepID=UPI003297FE61